ncbi:ATP-binding cassette domain-containing protein [Patescibacteria group bacterium]
MSVIEVQNLKKYFGKNKAVNDISFNIEKGEIFGFLGPNGAGKTTTIRCMMDFIRATDGHIKILGKDAHKETDKLMRSIGYLSGIVHLYDKWTGQTHFNYMQKLNGDKNIAKELSDRLEFDPTVRTKKLSSGNRQKLGIILSLMHQPEVLIYDEPTNALDPLLQNEVYKLLEEAQGRGATIFMSSHNLHEVERVCSRVGIIKKGRMVATESIESLREKRLYEVRVFFKNKVIQDQVIAPGIEIVKELDQGFVMTVKGDVNILLDRLEPLDIDDLEISYGSLEDIFLEYYQH